MNRKPSESQTQTLKTILQFRYLTNNNLATYKSITTNSAYSTLEILKDNGYVNKLHDKSYRLQNKSARYYLTQQGLDYLKKDQGIELAEAIWKTRKNAERKSTDFIDQQVAIHTTYNVLRAKLGLDTNILTSLELHGIQGIINPLSSLMVESRDSKRFFVEITDGQHLFIVKKRIRSYIQNYDDNEWDWDKYPDVYLIRSSASDRSRLRKYIITIMEERYLDEDDFSLHVISKAESIKLPA